MSTRADAFASLEGGDDGEPAAKLTLGWTTSLLTEGAQSYLREDSVFFTPDPTRDYVTEGYLNKLSLKLTPDVGDWLRLSYDGYVLSDGPRDAEIAYRTREMFCEVMRGPLIVSLGRRIENLGSNFFWEPLNILAPRKDEADYLDSKGLRNGVDLAKVEYFFGRHSVQIACSPVSGAGDLRSSRYGTLAKAYLSLNKFDVTAAVGFKGDGERLWGFDLSTVIGLFEVHSVLSHSFRSARQQPYEPWRTERTDGWQVIVGSLYGAGTKLILIGEYYHNHSGLGGNDWSSYADFLGNIRDNGPRDPRLYAGLTLAGAVYKPTTMRRNYLFGHASYELTSAITLSATTISSIDDGSIYFSPKVDWAPRSHVAAYCQATVSFGNDLSVFGLNPTGGSLRVGVTVDYTK
ncbi:MAG: hypothetical protein HYX75_07235 [Acidobacteria bacterium]|nr:hypothetical protein [Acidobacteriota bacterium]